MRWIRFTAEGRTAYGILEGDRIAVFLPTVEAAIALGRRTFRRAFYMAQTPEDPRLWLRGVVVDADDAQAFRSKPLLAMPGIERRVAGTAMRHALTTLHAGVRGMRRRNPAGRGAVVCPLWTGIESFRWRRLLPNLWRRSWRSSSARWAVHTVSHRETVTSL